MGRYSFTVHIQEFKEFPALLTDRVQESARVYQAASVRVQDDVPEMETLIMRLLTFVTRIDLAGNTQPGLYWALTMIPAENNADNQYQPIPPARHAVMAIQPLDVIQIELPEDIDSFNNENGETEMKNAGYVGNINRRAVPVIVVRYATAYPGLGTTKVNNCNLIAV